MRTRPLSLQDMRPAGESITAALVGIAIADGHLSGVHAPVLPLFDSYAPVANDGPEKRAITIEHLLTMTPGLDADADDESSPGYLLRIRQRRQQDVRLPSGAHGRDYSKRGV